MWLIVKYQKSIRELKVADKPLKSIRNAYLILIDVIMMYLFIVPDVVLMRSNFRKHCYLSGSLHPLQWIPSIRVTQTNVKSDLLKLEPSYEVNFT